MIRYFFTVFIITLLFQAPSNAAGGTVVDTEGTYAVTALSVSGDNIVIGNFDGNIRIVSPETSDHIKTLSRHTKPIVSLSSDLYGKYLLSSAGDGKLILWDVTNGKIIKEVFKPGMAFTACALDSTGRYAFAAFASSVYVWDTSTWENIAIWERIEGGVYSISVDGTGKVAAIGSKNGNIYIYSIPDGNLIKTLKAGDKIILSVAFAPESRILISGGYDMTGRVWDTDTGNIIKEFSRHTDGIRAVAAAKGGKKFATAGDDGGVFLWDISGKSESYSSSGTPPALSLALDPALRFIAAGKGAIFEDNKYMTLWYPSNRRQSRNMYAFSDAFLSLSPLGYVHGSGSFSAYVTVYESGRRVPLSQVMGRYNKPERLKINIGKGYIPK